MRSFLIGVTLFLLIPSISSAQIPGTEAIAAIVNGELILSGEIDAFMEQRKKPGVDFNTMEKSELNKFRSSVLKRLIDETILIQGIESQLSPTQKDSIRQFVERQAAEIIQRMQEQFTTPAALAQREEEMGVNWEELRQIQYRNLYKDYLVSVVAPQLMRGRISPPTEEELSSFKTDNPNLAEQETIRVSHILLRVPQDANDLQEKAALDKATEIANRARGGENFENLAMSNSEHQETKMQGGRIPPFKRGQLDAGFDALFNYPVNTITDPIRTLSGYHVVKVLEKETPESLLARQKMQDVLLKWTEELTASAKIEVKLKSE
ncbi:MAG: peptidylprolyl isomerase [Candidatus Hinthialibacter antarcticus]|nr:peptidylprolyl isomerase [Candidatus Hinthialibacter antarcticus]